MVAEKTSIPLSISSIQVTDEFWSRWQYVVFKRTLEIEYQQCKDTGRLENFARANRNEKGTFQGRYFNDSDVYKWIEAASYCISALGSDPSLDAKLSEVVELIVRAQMPDGYINTYFQVMHPDKRWKALATMHEMYCAGHLIEAGVAHFEATGRRELLDVCVRLADHIASLFGPEKRRGYCGHQEIELALCALARATGNSSYRDLAAWMVRERGKSPSPFAEELANAECLVLAPWMPTLFARRGAYSGEYVQDHLPLLEQTDVMGHSVRAMYFFAGAAESCDDDSTWAALELLWDRLTQRRMYVTGGIGSSGENEGFTKDYDLPNRDAYAETCAACGLVFWAYRMLLRTGDSQYADVMETALYNGALAGISLDGTKFFYDNPLESDGSHHRSDWFDCACCPPNIARLISSVGKYLVSANQQSFSIHVPASTTSTVDFGGKVGRIEVDGSYPWSGDFTVRFEADEPIRFCLRIRVPGWCDDFTVDVPEAFGELKYEEGYATLDRVWKPKDSIGIQMAMPARWVRTNLHVSANSGRVALQRGPLMYCLEECDLGSAVASFIVNTGVDSSTLEPDSSLEWALPIRMEGALERDTGDALYSDLSEREFEPRAVRAIPYYAWDNRAPGSMMVWLREAAASGDVVGR